MPLLNAFIDSVACVGFTSERGVSLDSESKSNGSLFTSSLQPSVLAIVNNNHAMYPQSRSSEFIDPLYPPIIPTIYHNLPLFCFPDGAHASWERENERIHHIVFTREDGKRTYALIFTFQQSFTLKADKPDDDGIYQINDVQRPTAYTRRISVSKIPIAIDKLKTTSSLPTTTTPPTVSLAPSSTPITPVKSRSRKMPSSFHFPEQPSGSRVRSSSTENLNKQPHYVTPTFSSYMK
ncbi:hypothetical protein I4U23_020936, partial [Adineta vaga]